METDVDIGLSMDLEQLQHELGRRTAELKALDPTLDDEVSAAHLLSSRDSVVDLTLDQTATPAE